MAARRILVVEDDPHTRRINVLALASAGYEVDEASDGAAAVEAALATRPDLVVMDIALPGLGGLEATRRIRDGVSPPPLVIILTARAMREDQEAARAAGCDGYLAKPIDPFDLVHEVRRLLAGRREGS